MEIRPFQNKDKKEVISLIAHGFQSKFQQMTDLSMEEIEHILEDTWGISEHSPKTGHFVAIIDDRIAGTILLKYEDQEREPEKSSPFSVLCKKYKLTNTIKYLIAMGILDHKLLPKECYIEHIAVNKEFRGLGVGSKLIEYSIVFAQTLPHVDHLSLNVAATNQGAFALYKRLGFQENNKYFQKSLLSYALTHEREWIYMTKSVCCQV